MQNQENRLQKTLAIYGRKPVLEALGNPTLTIDKVHLADSNRSSAVISKIEQAAKEKEIPIEYKSRKALSYISKNTKQDQGVAADLYLQHYHPLEALSSNLMNANTPREKRLLLLDGVSNPQNVGMIIRSVAAAGIGGIILPKKGCADLNALTIKASAGAAFKCPIYRCASCEEAVRQLRLLNSELVVLDAKSSITLEAFKQNNTQQNRHEMSATIFILGNETEGVSTNIADIADTAVNIPMYNGVESLNVAIAAALVAFS